MRLGPRFSAPSFAAASARRAIVALALTLTAGAPPLFPDDSLVESSAPGPAHFLEPVDGFLAAATTDALTRAERELADPRCDKVFSDFRDPKGTSLQSSLEAQGTTGRRYLRQLRFANGERLAACAAGALAGTKPGSRVIFLCGTRFAAAHRTNPRLGTALLIHEELHSLGLGENPPTSLEITAAVLARCGR